MSYFQGPVPSKSAPPRLFSANFDYTERSFYDIEERAMSHQDKAQDDNNLLTSWKEISAYLGRDVRTCLRWEKSFGLPIHRLDPDADQSRALAHRNELDKGLHHRQ